MKPIPLALALFWASHSSLLSQEPPASAPATAKIVGEVADGTSTPVVPNPGFVVPSGDILDRKTIAQGGRKIVVQRIAPMQLPPRPAQGPPVDIADPALQQRVADLREAQPNSELLFVGATVFRPDDSPPRTLVRLCPMNQGQTVTFWSSADFAVLSGFSSFTGTDGKIRSLIMAWDSQKGGSMNELLQKQGAGPDAARVPAIPAGPATFIITSAQPVAEALAAIQSLHDLYNNEYDRLETAFEARETARLAQEAEIKAHPPKPKDIVLKLLAHRASGSRHPAPGRCPVRTNFTSLRCSASGVRCSMFLSLPSVSRF